MYGGESGEALTEALGHAISGFALMKGRKNRQIRTIKLSLSN